MHMKKKEQIESRKMQYRTQRKLCSPPNRFYNLFLVYLAGANFFCFTFSTNFAFYIISSSRQQGNKNQTLFFFWFLLHTTISSQTKNPEKSEIHVLDDTNTRDGLLKKNNICNKTLTLVQPYQQATKQKTKKTHFFSPTSPAATFSSPPLYSPERRLPSPPLVISEFPYQIPRAWGSPTIPRLLLLLHTVYLSAASRNPHPFLLLFPRRVWGVCVLGEEEPFAGLIQGTGTCYRVIGGWIRWDLFFSWSYKVEVVFFLKFIFKFLFSICGDAAAAAATFIPPLAARARGLRLACSFMHPFCFCVVVVGYFDPRKKSSFNLGGGGGKDGWFACEICRARSRELEKLGIFTCRSLGENDVIICPHLWFCRLVVSVIWGFIWWRFCRAGIVYY